MIASSSDLPELLRLINAAYGGEASPTQPSAAWTNESELVGGERTNLNQLREMMSTPNACFLVRRDGERLVGCVYLEKSDDACYLGLFSVDPQAQQNGVGRALLAQAERFARDDLRCTRMWMSVIHQRPELIDYYRRRGYEPTGETRPFPVPERLRRPDIYFDVLEKSLINL